MDAVCRTDTGSYVGARQPRRRSRPRDDFADQLCGGPCPAIFSERAGDRFVLSIFAAPPWLRASDSRRRWYSFDHRRHSLDQRLHDVAECLRFALHATVVVTATLTSASRFLV